jgi:hypothetical protein
MDCVAGKPASRATRRTFAVVEARARGIWADRRVCNDGVVAVLVAFFGGLWAGDGRRRQHAWLRSASSCARARDALRRSRVRLVSPPRLSLAAGARGAHAVVAPMGATDGWRGEQPRPSGGHSGMLL